MKKGELLVIVALGAIVLLAAMIVFHAYADYRDEQAREKYPLPPVPTPTQVLPQVMEVNASVNGASYDGRWGEMLYQYGRAISFWTIEGHRTYFATYFDFAANSAMDPRARPGLLMEGGTWTQDKSEIVVQYSETYDYDLLLKLEEGNISHYEKTRILRCLDPDCRSLLDDSGITYNYEFNMTDMAGTGGNVSSSLAETSNNVSKYQGA